MTDTEQEGVEAPETEHEMAGGDELAPDEEEAAEAEEPAEEPVEEPEPEAPAGMSEKEMEATRKKLDAENTRHRSRISDLLGEEALLLDPCPLCSGFADGYRFPVVPPQDVIDATRVAIGMPDLSNYQQARNATMCTDCQGLGVVLSGSLVSGNVAIDCATCHASGYVIVQTGTGELVAPTPGNGAAVGQTFAGVNPDDPEVKALQARGFTVIPPMQPLAGV